MHSAHSLRDCPYSAAQPRDPSPVWVGSGHETTEDRRSEEVGHAS